MAVLDNARHERIAQLLAANCSAEEASAQAGYDRNKSSFAPNARKRAQRPEIRARVKELQGQVADRLVDVTAEWIQQRVAKIAAAEIPIEDVRASDVIAAARLLAQMIPGAMAPTKVASTNPDGDGPPLAPEITDEDRIRALTVLLARQKTGIS